MLAGTIPSPKERMQEQHLLVSAYPAGWMDRYLDQDYARIDPIIHRIKRDPSPFPWSEDVALPESENCPLAKKMFNEAAEFNLRAGFAVPLITLDGAVAVVSLGGEAVEMPPEAHAMTGMISTFAIARAIDLCNGGGGHKRPKLTPREIECLKWAADGKTEWEISTILHVSEHTADKHLANAHRKLGATNCVQAVAVAIRWGFIS